MTQDTYEQFYALAVDTANRGHNLPNWKKAEYTTMCPTYRITTRNGLFRVEVSKVSGYSDGPTQPAPIVHYSWRDRLGSTFGSFADAKEARDTVKVLDAAEAESWIEVAEVAE